MNKVTQAFETERLVRRMREVEEAFADAEEARGADGDGAARMRGCWNTDCGWRGFN